MINIFKYTQYEKTVDEEYQNCWRIISSHTQVIDAEAQLQRFIDSEIPVEQLKIVSDDSDPNAPTQELQP